MHRVNHLGDRGRRRFHLSWNFDPCGSSQHHVRVARQARADTSKVKIRAILMLREANPFRGGATTSLQNFLQAGCGKRETNYRGFQSTRLDMLTLKPGTKLIAHTVKFVSANESESAFDVTS